MKRLLTMLVVLTGLLGSAGAMSVTAEAELSNSSNYIWSLQFSCGVTGKNGFFKISKGQKIIDGKLKYSFRNGAKLELEHEKTNENAGEFSGFTHFPDGLSSKYWIKYKVTGKTVTGWGTLNGNSFNPCTLKGRRTLVAEVNSNRPEKKRKIKAGIMNLKEKNTVKKTERQTEFKVSKNRPRTQNKIVIEKKLQDAKRRLLENKITFDEYLSMEEEIFKTFRKTPTATNPSRQKTYSRSAPNTQATTTFSQTPIKSINLKTGNVFQDCDQCPQMVVIPGGQFEMGTLNDGAIGVSLGLADERPAHTVRFGAMFALSVHEVTVEEYRDYANESNVENGKSCLIWNGATPRNKYWIDWESPGYVLEDRQPVVCLSTVEMEKYVSWLSKKSGKNYRLPSEAEWEYAARAGTSTPFWWGRVAFETNKTVCTHCGSKWDDLSPAPVGQFSANSFGLHDTLGNVYEVTGDCYYPDYTNAPDDGRPQKRGECSTRVMRGGSWNDSERNIRSRVRMTFPAGFRSNRVGFRIARSIE